ncbi:MAG: hypothetical protein NZ840_12760 [Anaerolineales bacterium]|nr:hypothetical protein [Anaerolineales bacterium]MDW8162907.1 hypothetical protein [Anaerolineales bacterium]
MLGELGPKPLDPLLNAQTFSQRLRGLPRQLKPFVARQRFLADPDDIHTVAALRCAGFHP